MVPCATSGKALLAPKCTSLPSQQVNSWGEGQGVLPSNSATSLHLRSLVLLSSPVCLSVVVGGMGVVPVARWWSWSPKLPPGA
jgi:hypothetical protein